MDVSQAKNFGHLAQLIAGLARVPSRVSRDVAQDIRRRITRQFTTETDPYGNAWAPYTAGSIRRGRRPPLLTDTARMRRGIRVRPSSGAGVEITVPAPYAGFHQTGTSTMARRAILPYGTLPRAWSAAIQRRLTAAVRGAL